MTTDISTRFLFRDSDTRGNLISLDEAYQEVVTGKAYPPAVQSLLGEFLAGALLLSETVKFRGRLLLQARTDGPLRVIMAEANHNREVRGIARLAEGTTNVGDSFEALMAGGTLAVIIEQEGQESYQSLVPLIGSSLAECLEFYFAQSEQLGTMIRLAATNEGVGGLLLQQLPPQLVRDKKRREVIREHLEILGGSVRDSELLSLEHPVLIKRLFVEETIEVYAPEAVRFACSCNESRLANSLLSLGATELQSLFAETPTLELTCEFCQATYLFTAEQLTELVKGDSAEH